MVATKIFKRDVLDDITKLAKRKEIICIRGPRQAGKTTLLKIIAGKTPGKQSFLNMDEPSNRKALEEAPLDLVKRLTGDSTEITLFFDEIQRVSNAGEKLKLIFDESKNTKMLLSGSSSLGLKTNVLPFLVGRLLLFDLLTFSFSEFLGAKDAGLHKVFEEKHKSLIKFIEGEETTKTQLEGPSLTEDFLKYWEEYLLFGGYPEVVKAKSKEEKLVVLKNITDLYLEKDIVSFFKIEETSKFEDTLKTLAYNSSNILNTASIGTDVGITHYRLMEYLNILANTYIIELIRPFYKNMTTEIKKARKLYFLDLGLRNAVLDNFSELTTRTDAGQLAENFIFRELKTSGYKTKYWRTTGKAEVDFVAEAKDGIVPIEVKLNQGKLGKSFYSFLDVYKPKRAIVTTTGAFRKQKIGTTMIYFVPIFYF